MGAKHREGPTDPLYAVKVALTSSKPTRTIAIGDFIALVGNFAVPSTSFAFDTNEATTQTAFAAAFLGVSQSASEIGSTDPRALTIAVDQDGNFDAPMVSAVYRLNDLVGIATNGTNATLGTLKASSTEARSIGIVVDDDANARTVARVRLLNTPAKRG